MHKAVRPLEVPLTDETAGSSFDSLPMDSLLMAQTSNQDRVGIRMVKALQRWLATNELPLIILGVIGALLALSMLLVLGGYLLVT
jgi:hypothetical protein